jgi:hypothetical protein
MAWRRSLFFSRDWRAFKGDPLTFAKRPAYWHHKHQTDPNDCYEAFRFILHDIFFS